MSRNAVVYIRCSTSQQAITGHSLDTQKKGCSQFAKSNNLYIKRYFTDDGISGTSLAGRVEFQAALKELKKGDVFLVYSLSRISRNLRDMVGIIDAVEQKDAEIMSVTENLQDEKFGMLNLGVATVMAQFESKQIGDRVRDTMKKLKESRGTSNCKARYGYKYDKNEKDEDGKLLLLPHESEYEVLQLIKQLRSEKYHNPRHPRINEEPRTYKYIADELNKRGIPTRTKNRDPNKPPRRWHPSTIKKILDAEIEQEESPQQSQEKVEDVIYLLVKSTHRILGSAPYPASIFDTEKAKKALIYIFPCNNHSESYRKILSLLVERKYVDPEEDDTIILPSIETQDVLSLMKENSERELITTTVGEIPTLFSD